MPAGIPHANLRKKESPAYQLAGGTSVLLCDGKIGISSVRF